jgi:O-acetyl-ADP-ribose deacetylase (regulator of RNase III)
MKTLSGDLLKLADMGFFDVIIHGANCFCTMGAGIAAQIRKKYPEAYKADCNTKKGDKKKLGTYSMATIYNAHLGKKLLIINAYTQYGFAKGKIKTDYNAVESVFGLIKKNLGGSSLKFGYPKIGAGLGGGDWSIISNIICEKMIGEDHMFISYKT